MHCSTRLQYLKRPGILWGGPLLLLLLGLLYLFRRERRLVLDRALLLTTLWIGLYTLVLSLAYYTPRGALLAVLLGVVLLLSFIWRATHARFPAVVAARLSLALTGVLLLLAMVKTYDYEWRLLADRVWAGRLSREAESQLGRDGLAQEPGWWGMVQAAEMRLTPLRANPWCEPYRRDTYGWLEDPGIGAVQLPGLPYRGLEHKQIAVPPAEFTLETNLGAVELHWNEAPELSVKRNAQP